MDMYSEYTDRRLEVDTNIGPEQGSAADDLHSVYGGPLVVDADTAPDDAWDGGYGGGMAPGAEGAGDNYVPPPEGSGDSGASDTAEASDRPRHWRPGEVRPKLIGAVALLDEHGVSAVELLRGRPALQELLPALLDGKRSADDIAAEWGYTPKYVKMTVGRALDHLLRVTPKPLADQMPKPTGGFKDVSREPTDSVGAWIDAFRKQSNVPVDHLAQAIEKSQDSVYRVLRGTTHPVRSDIVFMLRTLGIDPDLSGQILRAYSAEKKGDLETAKAILESIGPPEPPVQEESTPSEEPYAAPEQIASSADESIGFGLEPAQVVVRWASGQLRSTLRLVDAALKERGGSVESLIPRKGSNRAIRQALPMLLDAGLSNNEIAQRLGVENARVSRWTRKILATVAEKLPEDVVAGIPKPAGSVTRSRNLDTAGGELRRRMQAAGISQTEAAQAIGVHLGTVSRLLLGERRPPMGVTFVPLVRLLRQREVLTADEANGMVQQYEQERAEWFQLVKERRVAAKERKDDGRL